MNICLATSTFPANSADSAHAIFLLEVIRVLERHGHRVTVLTQARADDPVAPIRGHAADLRDLDVVRFPWRQLGNRLAELNFGSYDGLLSAASLIYGGTRHASIIRRTRHIDVFLCAWVIPSGFYVYLDQLIGRSGTPYVLWALGSDVNKYKSNPLVRGALSRVAARAGAVYADGYRLCNDVGAITGTSCEFLPTFRALPRIPGAEPHARHSLPRFLYVGRHATVKGIDVLVDALVEMKKLGDPEYRIDLVGDGDLTAGLGRTIAGAGLSERVRFRGRLSDEELARAYAESDCVVIPSRSESIPIVMSEALQHGLPLLVTDVGDMGDLTRRYGLGKVVPSESPRALAEGLRDFVATPWQLDAARAAELLADLTFESAVPKLLTRLASLVGSESH